MDEASRSSVCSFLTSVARHGNQISHILHECASSETHLSPKISALLANLNATIHYLDHLCNLLSLQVQSSALLNDEGLKYIKILAEECSVAICKVAWITKDSNCHETIYNPKYWKSPVLGEVNGQILRLTPDLDEAVFFRDIKKGNGGALLSALRGPAHRLDYLQLLLLLVVQVITLQHMTNKL